MSAPLDRETIARTLGLDLEPPARADEALDLDSAAALPRSVLVTQLLAIRAQCEALLTLVGAAPPVRAPRRPPPTEAGSLTFGSDRGAPPRG